MPGCQRPESACYIPAVRIERHKRLRRIAHVDNLHSIGAFSQIDGGANHLDMINITTLRAETRNFNWQCRVMGIDDLHSLIAGDIDNSIGDRQRVGARQQGQMPDPYRHSRRADIQYCQGAALDQK